MKICGECGQIAAQEISTRPSCGAEVAAGRAAIEGCRIAYDFARARRKRLRQAAQ